MAGRTSPKFVRVYIDGMDYSGMTRSISPLTYEYELADLTAQYGDYARGALPNMPHASPGTLNTVFNVSSDDSAARHTALATQNDDRVVIVAIGSRAAPVQGDPVFCGEFSQLGYTVDEDGGAIVANVVFGPRDIENMFAYSDPWGTLAHPLALADSDGNAAVGYDDGAGATTAFGGYMVWAVTAGSGTATITMEHDDSSDSDGFAAIGGLTTGAIDCDSNVQYGVAVTTAKTTEIMRYTRWQCAIDDADVTFALAFVRGAAHT